MILSESLWPGMTRHGFGYKTCVRVKTADRENFPVTKANLWLPLARVAVKEFDIAQGRYDFLNSLNKQQNFRSMAGIAFEAMALDDAQGCWVSNNIVAEDVAGHTEALWDIADHDMGGRPLDDPNNKDALRVCDEPDCLNARHYDFTHEKKYRDRMLVPDYDHYQTLEDGSIMTSWGIHDGFVMPSVRQSIADFRELQQRCVPYTNESKKAPLTDNGISKIVIDEQTGCWAGRMYYTRPQDGFEGYQFDSYGRLGAGPGLREPGERGFQMLGHRATWMAVGRILKKGMVLNHECGFRPCCYPGHLTQTTNSGNVLHGNHMKSSKNRIKLAV